jgi:hypothetical protein
VILHRALHRDANCAGLEPPFRVPYPVEPRERSFGR